MILHLIKDEKITDNIIQNFMDVSEKNYFLVLTTDEKRKISHTIKTDTSIGIFYTTIDDINEIIQNKRVKAIIIHFLVVDFAKVILKVRNPNLPIAWIAWGNDIYGLPELQRKIFAPATKQFMRKINPFLPLEQKIKGIRLLRKIFYERIKRTPDHLSVIFRAMDRINYFVSYIREDYEVLNSYYPNKLKFIQSTFCTIDQYLGGTEGLYTKSDAQNILLGNSNYEECNYLDAIPVLADHMDSEKMVYVVLSYGKNDAHKKKVMEVGYTMLKEHFTPLLEMLNRESYVKIMQSCSVGIFNHYRQQAMGNIIALLYLGARVYLSEKNPAYRFFLRNEIKVNSFEKEFSVFGTNRLSTDVAINNREKIYAIFNTPKVHLDLVHLSQVLLKK